MKLNRKTITSALVALTASAAFSAAVGNTADAYQGETRAIPSLQGASGSATLQSFGNGRAYATVTVRRGSNSHCVYAQAAPYAIAALDGGFKTIPGSRSCGATANGTYTDRYYLAYNGVKFRLCQEDWLADTCGSSVNIRG